MKLIQLTKGMYAKVDDADYEWLNQWKWYFHPSVSGSGYARRSYKVEGKNHYIYMHRLIVKPPEGLEVDHINREKLDNRRVNLRACTKSENQANKWMPNNKSGVSGVRWDKNRDRWKVSFSRNKHTYNIGYFKNKDVAIEARRAINV